MAAPTATTYHRTRQMSQSNTSVISIGSKSSTTDGQPKSSLSTSRKVTPIRPVYDDFQTAHLYITSGSAKSKQDLTPNVSFSSNPASPLPPIPAVLKHDPKSAPQLPEVDLGLSTVDFVSSPAPNNRSYSSTPVINQSLLQGDSSKSGSWKDFLDRLSNSAKRRRQELTASPSRLQRRAALCNTHNDNLDESLEGDDNTRLLLSPSEVDAYRSGLVFSAQPDLDSNITADAQLKTTGSSSETCSIKAGYFDQSELCSHASGPGFEVTQELPSINSLRLNGLKNVLMTNLELSKEDSTVSNIVRHYERNEENYDSDEEGSGDSQRRSNNTLLVTSEQWSTKSDLEKVERKDCRAISGIQQGISSLLASNPPVQYLALRMEIPSGRPPSSELPQIPTFHDHCALGSTSDGLAQSTSYGDTRNLLELTQRTQWNLQNAATAPDATSHAAPIEHGHLMPKGVQIDSPRNSSQHSDSSSVFSPNSRLHSAREQATALHQFAEFQKEDSTEVRRIALERDISFALRHEGSYSNLSDDSIVKDRGNGGFQSSSDSGALHSLLDDNETDHSVTQTFQQPFYEQSMIPEDWLDSQKFNQIRIPIKDHESSSSRISSSSPSTISDQFELETLRRNEDINEWETVGDSGNGSQAATNVLDTMEVNFNHSGTNASDDGKSMPAHYETNAHPWKGHILTHPSNSPYAHAYRRREIKTPAIPVLLPAHQNFTVNGFPTNTSRPPIDIYPLSPLSVNHRNPFVSSPPNVTKTSSDESQATQSTSIIPDGRIALKAKSNAPQVASSSVGTSKGSGSFVEMETLGKEQVPFLGDENPFNINIPSNDGAEVSSMVSSFRNRDAHTVGSSIADASTSSIGRHSSSAENLQEPLAKTPISFIAPSYGIVQQNGSQNTVFGKRPPGAFYEGLRSIPKPRNPSRNGGPNPTRTPRRPTTQYTYATNKMRPLSLLTSHHVSNTANGSQSGDFLYRSPLAPLRSENWCTLYTREQLNNIYEASRVEASSQISISPPSPSYGETIRTEGSWRRLQGVPKLFPWPREDSSVKSGTATRKFKFSVFGLVLCALFPPALPLYGYGLLDGMLLWVTKGEISHFGRTQKRIARYMTWFFVAVVLTSVIVGIYYSRRDS